MMLVVISTSAGCQDVRMPRIFSWPGSVRYQRQQAAIIDPYAQDEMHDVALNGTRPPDYDRPWSEVKRAQMSPYAPLSLGK
jgi:hypothetical protein